MLSLVLMVLTFQPSVTDTLWAEEGEGYSIEVLYPEIALENETIGNLLQDYATAQVTDFIEQYHEFTDEGFATDDWYMELHLNHELSPDGIECILAWHWEYTGGAHGNTFTKAFIFDLSTDSMIGTVELLGGEQEFQLFAKAVIEELKATQVDETWIERGASAELQNYHSVVPVPAEDGSIAGYTVFFPPYQVACYACGTIEVFIPKN